MSNYQQNDRLDPCQIILEIISKRATLNQEDGCPDVRPGTLWLLKLCAERENHRFGEIEADVATVRFGRFGEIWKEVIAPFDDNAAAAADVGLHVDAGCHDDNDDGLHGDSDDDGDDDDEEDDEDEDEDDEEKSDGRLVRKIHLAVSRGPADKLHPVINYTR